jgi:hypothetical protein
VVRKGENLIPDAVPKRSEGIMMGIQGVRTTPLSEKESPPMKIMTAKKLHSILEKKQNRK